MSSCSDDTDVLLLIPSDVFEVTDEPGDGQGYHRPDTDGLLERIYTLEDKFKVLEDNVLSNSMRRFSSADALPTNSKSQYVPRSLQVTPMKLRNMLYCEPYLSQKCRDEERLREIDEYFSQRHKDDPERPIGTGKRLELSEVKSLLLEVEETQRAALGRLNLEECFTNTSRSEDTSKQPSSARRALLFDSPSKGQVDTVREIYNPDRNEECHGTVPDSKRGHELHSMLPDNSRQTTYEELQLLKQRLEEERCRRQHCESLIHNLQKSLLEGEEKLVVALKIDEEKDHAIKKLREGWNNVAEHWKDIEARNKDLAEKLLDEKQTFLEEKETLISSVKRYEIELSKALDLAHGYKEKCESATKEQRAVMRERESIKLDLDKVKDELQSSEETVIQLNEIIAKKEEALNQSQAKISELLGNLKEVKKQLKLSLVDSERLQQEQSAKIEVQNKLDEALKRESQLQVQIRGLSKNKADLKKYYQEQVQRIVDEKQKEFQAQLLNAEQALKKQFEGKERNVEESMRQQIQQLAEKHKIEVALLEEKHCQEIKLVEIRVAESNQKVDDLQRIISDRACLQQELAEKLHGVMENQWKETLRVISSTKSLNQIGDVNDKPVLSRQNTFTLTDEKLKSCETSDHRKGGSMTYRVNEVPQNLSAEPKVKDYIEKLLQNRSFDVDESCDTSNFEVASSSMRYLNSTDSTYSSKFCSASSKPPWKG